MSFGELAGIALLAMIAWTVVSDGVGWPKEKIGCLVLVIVAATLILIGISQKNNNSRTESFRSALPSSDRKIDATEIEWAEDDGDVEDIYIEECNRQDHYNFKC